MGFVRYGALTADVEPAFTETEAMKPMGQEFVGDALVAEFAHGSHTNLGATERTGRAVNASARPETMIERINKGPVGGSLFIDGGEAALDFFFWELKSESFVGVLHAEKRRSGGK